LDKLQHRRVTVEFDYQFILEMITMQNLRVLEEIERNNRAYSYQAKIIGNRTRFKLSRKFRQEKEDHLRDF